MTDHNDELHDAALRLAGMLGLRHAMKLPAIRHAHISQQFQAGTIVLAMYTRGDVDRLAEVLGVDGEARLDLLDKGHGSYFRQDHHWRIVVDETAPFEPLTGDDPELDAEQAAGGSTFHSAHLQLPDEYGDGF